MFGLTGETWFWIVSVAVLGFFAVRMALGLVSYRAELPSVDGPGNRSPNTEDVGLDPDAPPPKDPTDPNCRT